MLKLNEIDDIQENYQAYQNQRNKMAVSIRREQRESVFMKRRRLDVNSEPKEKNSCQVCGGTEHTPHQEENTSDNYQEKKNQCRVIVIDPRFSDQIYEIASKQFTPEMIEDLATCIRTTENILLGVMGLRRIVSFSENPPIQEIIDTGIVSELLDLVKQTQFPQFRLQALWTLTNIAAGQNHQCSVIVSHEGIPILIEVLDSSNIDLIEQAIWALGNLAIDSIAYRDTIIQMGMIRKLVELFFQKQQECESIIEEACWCVSGLLRGRQLPSFDKIQEGLNMLCVLFSLDKLKKETSISDCLWGISAHCIPSGTNNKKFQFILDTYLIQKLIPLLMETEQKSIFVPGFNIITNLTVCSDKFTSRMIENKVLDLLQLLIKHKKKDIRRKACWALSNLAAGKSKHVIEILTRDTLVSLLLSMFASDSLDVRKEICYIFANMVYGGKDIPKLDTVFLQLGLIQYYVNILNEADNDELIQEVLNTLEHLLRMGQNSKRKRKADTNDFVMELYRNGGVDVLQKLQETGSQEVYQKLTILIPQYFQTENPLEIRY